MRRLLVVCGLAILTATCAARMAQRPPAPRVIFENPIIVAAPFDTVWTEALRVMFRVGVPIGSTDKQAGLISSSEFQTRGSNCDCSDAGALALGERRVQIELLLAPVDSAATSITVRSRFAALDITDGYGRWVTCQSTGAMEAALMNAVSVRWAANE